MDKITRASKRFRLFFQVCFALVPIIFVFIWWDTPNDFSFKQHLGMYFGYLPQIPNIALPVKAHVRWLAIGVSAIPQMFYMLILYHLIKLFNLYESGSIFSIPHVRLLRKIGVVLLLSQIVARFCDSLMTMLLTWYNKPMQRFIQIEINDANIGLMIAASLIILISWIMLEGYKLQEEQKYTV